MNQRRIIVILQCLLYGDLACAAQQSIPAATASVQNQHLTVTAQSSDGSYAISMIGTQRPVIRASVAAKIDYHWIKSSEYPKHAISKTAFSDALGHGERLTILSTGLNGKPNLICNVRLYDELPYGDVEVTVENHSSKSVTVQALRSVEANGNPVLDLGERPSSLRIASDTFSTDVEAPAIYDLGQRPDGFYRAAGSQLIYDRDSRKSLFFGPVTARKFVTQIVLRTKPGAKNAEIDTYTVDSIGTTEPLRTSDSCCSYVKDLPKEDQIELSLPVAPKASLSSERVMFSVGTDYFAQLDAYGAAIRQLFKARVSAEPIRGWGTENIYAERTTEGFIRTNLQWLEAHLKDKGFEYVTIDEGPPFSYGDWTTADANKIPHGMRALYQEITSRGFKVAGWTLPFTIDPTSWIYQHHKNWLVRNAKGQPIRLIKSSLMSDFDQYVLDVTHPDVQTYLRQMYRTAAREFDWRYFKIDGMDYTLIEGYRYRPNVTAIETQKILLQLLREAMGPDVLFEKDGGPFLSSVGFVDFGRSGWDTGHVFQDVIFASTGLATHYYMHRNFWVTDPAYFNLQSLAPMDFHRQDGDGSSPGYYTATPPQHPLNEAQVAIVLAAINGGEYEFSDDLPTLATQEPDRLALVTNPDLLQTAKLGRVAKPLDLMTYRPEDERPSVSFLREDDRQSMLAVFNWTTRPQSHVLRFSEIGLKDGNSYELYDVLNGNQSIDGTASGIHLDDMAPHSVKLIKIIDKSIPAAAPSVVAQVPATAKMLDDVGFSAQAAPQSVPALSYHWDFGDDTSANGAVQTHTYTTSGTHKVSLTVEGLDGITATKTFSVAVYGLRVIGPPNRRYEEPTDSP